MADNLCENERNTSLHQHENSLILNTDKLFRNAAELVMLVKIASLSLSKD